MTHSANEIAALAQKAAVGAGFPPAQAETFGRAAALHLGAGKAASAVQAALQDQSNSPVLRLPLLMEDVLRALTLGGPEVELTLHPGDEALATAYARLLPIHVIDCAVIAPKDAQARLRVAAETAEPERPRPAGRVAAPRDLVRTLSALAAKTVVPASADSRAGAGAGNIDND